MLRKRIVTLQLHVQTARHHNRGATQTQRPFLQKFSHDVASWHFFQFEFRNTNVSKPPILGIINPYEALNTFTQPRIRQASLAGLHTIATVLFNRPTLDISGRQPRQKRIRNVFFQNRTNVSPNPLHQSKAPSHRRLLWANRPHTSGKELVYEHNSAASKYCFTDYSANFGM